MPSSLCDEDDAAVLEAAELSQRMSPLPSWLPRPTSPELRTASVPACQAAVASMLQCESSAVHFSSGRAQAVRFAMLTALGWTDGLSRPPSRRGSLVCTRHEHESVRAVLDELQASHGYTLRLLDWPTLPDDFHALRAEHLQSALTAEASLLFLSAVYPQLALLVDQRPVALPDSRDKVVSQARRLAPSAAIVQDWTDGVRWMPAYCLHSDGRPPAGAWPRLSDWQQFSSHYHHSTPDVIICAGEHVDALTDAAVVVQAWPLRARPAAGSGTEAESVQPPSLLPPSAPRASPPASSLLRLVSGLQQLRGDVDRQRMAQDSPGSGVRSRLPFLIHSYMDAALHPNPAALTAAASRDDHSFSLRDSISRHALLMHNLQVTGGLAGAAFLCFRAVPAVQLAAALAAVDIGSLPQLPERASRRLLRMHVEACPSTHPVVHSWQLLPDWRDGCLLLSFGWLEPTADGSLPSTVGPPGHSPLRERLHDAAFTIAHVYLQLLRRARPHWVETPAAASRIDRPQSVTRLEKRQVLLGQSTAVHQWVDPLQYVQPPPRPRFPFTAVLTTAVAQVDPSAPPVPPPSHPRGPFLVVSSGEDYVCGVQRYDSGAELMAAMRSDWADIQSRLERPHAPLPSDLDAALFALMQVQHHRQDWQQEQWQYCLELPRHPQPGSGKWRSWACGNHQWRPL